jgi:hypothetical protein
VWSTYRHPTAHLDVTRERPSSPKGRPTVRLAIFALVLLTVISGAASAVSAGSTRAAEPVLAIPAAKTYGIPGQQFQMSFLSQPSTCLPNGECGLEIGCANSTSQCGWNSIGVVSRRTWSAGDEFVWIWNLKKPVTQKTTTADFGQFLGFGYRSTFEGHPAVRELVACSTPSGPCPGYVGGIDVIDGSTMYVVSTTGWDKATTEAILDTFRIIA